MTWRAHSKRAPKRNTIAATRILFSTFVAWLARFLSVTLPACDNPFVFGT
jgi:hypothetical protein